MDVNYGLENHKGIYLKNERKEIILILQYRPSADLLVQPQR